MRLEFEETVELDLIVKAIQDNSDGEVEIASITFSDGRDAMGLLSDREYQTILDRACEKARQDMADAKEEAQLSAAEARSEMRCWGQP